MNARSRSPSTILSRAPGAAGQRPAGAQGRDRAARPRHLHRVVAARAPVATQAAAVHPRRAGRLVGLGALPRLLRRSRLGGPRAEPAQPLLVADRPTRRRCRSTPTPRTSSRRWIGSARRPWRSATGWAGCSRSRRPSGWPSPGWSCSPGACRATCAPPARSHELREIPEVYGRERHRLGDAPREARARRSRPDPRRRPARSSTCSARSRTRPAPRDARCWRACRSIGGPSPRSRAWSSAAASTGRSTLDDAERLAEWLGAEYEPFGAHSHFGLDRRRAEPPAGGRGDPGVPGDAPALAGRRRRRLRGRRVCWYPVGRRRRSDRRRRLRRIRLEAQDTALSRRRSPVRIRYAVPILLQRPDMIQSALLAAHPSAHSYRGCAARHAGTRSVPLTASCADLNVETGSCAPVPHRWPARTTSTNLRPRLPSANAQSRHRALRDRHPRDATRELERHGEQQKNAWGTDGRSWNGP